jgi:ectoine hydroxylase-related dioxygenase (phytanoyl-CoA dioxygenase family)
MTVLQDAAQTYDRDGCLTRIDIFDPEEIAHFRRLFDQLEEREGRETCQIGLQSWHFKEEFIWKMSTDARLLDAVESVVGDDLLLLSTHFFCKYPVREVEHFVAWHQDVTYWGLKPPEAHTAWIAVDDSDLENGCMQIIPGTHKTGIVSHDTSEDDSNLLSINQEISDEHVDKDSVVPLELGAGQISIHHGQLFHASYPNTSQRRRCGLAVRFSPPHVNQTKLNSVGKHWPVLLVRGEDRYHNFPETPLPFDL